MNSSTTHQTHDVTFTFSGQTLTITHQDNLFTGITVSKFNPLEWLVEIYKSEQTGVIVLIDTLYAYYFLVKDNKVVHKPLVHFETARQIADNFDYNKWLKMQNTKGLPKKQFILDVTNGKTMARRTYTRFDNRCVDNKFHPLVKTKGKGSIDIDRDGDVSVVFYIDSMKASLMWYSGEKLVIYNGGYRLYNEEERKCVLDWEARRDREAEMLDLITDGSAQFYRKKDFFTNRGFEYLLRQRFRGLVQDDNIREAVNLEYSILKL